LALLYYSQRKYEEAEPLLKRALEIKEKTLGSEHPAVALGLENYAVLLHKLNRGPEAEKLEARAREIREKAKTKQ
jgi:tetratricopeptide (TPR) repeat protein